MSDERRTPRKKRGLRSMEEVTSPPPKTAPGGSSKHADLASVLQEGQTWGTCFIPVTEEMVKHEKMLKTHVMRGYIIGPHIVPPEDVHQAVCTQFNVPSIFVKVCRSYPSDYLLQFAAKRLAEEVNKQKIVSGPGFEVVVWPWEREEESDEVVFNTKIKIKMQGVPPHAWNASTVHSLLDDYCYVQTIQMPKLLTGDMSSVHVTALAPSVHQIPPMVYLAIPEPASGRDLCLTTDSVTPSTSAARRRYPVKITTQEITNKQLLEKKAQEEPKEQDDSDSAPSGAFDYESPVPPGSPDTGYGYDSDREPAGWK